MPSEVKTVSLPVTFLLMSVLFKWLWDLARSKLNQDTCSLDLVGYFCGSFTSAFSYFADAPNAPCAHLPGMKVYDQQSWRCMNLSYGN